MVWATRPIEVQEGVEEWTEFCIVPYTVGVVDEAFPGDRWKMSTLIYGDGNYCHIEEGGHILNSTGGWYFSLGIQLPDQLVVNESIELRSISSFPNGEVRKLKRGEIVALQFGNPTAWSLVSGIESPVGSITVLELNKQFVRLHVKANIPLKGKIIPNDERVLELDREFRLDYRSPVNPLESLPRKSQITKPSNE
jgi:hypothetical protein